MTTLQETLIKLKEREFEISLWFPRSHTEYKKNAFILKMSLEEFDEVCYDKALELELELKQVRTIIRSIEELIN